MGEKRPPPPRGPSWRRQAKERRAPFCLSAHTAARPSPPRLTRSSLPPRGSPLPNLSTLQKSRRRTPLTAITERPGRRFPHNNSSQAAQPPSAAATLKNRGDKPRPPSPLQAPGCNRGAGAGGCARGSRGAFWGRTGIRRYLSNGAVRLWRWFGRAATRSVSQDSRQFESLRQRRGGGRGLSPAPGVAVRRWEGGSRSLWAGVSAARWGGLSSTRFASAAGAKPVLRSVGPAGDISWESHCSCDFTLSFLDM